MQMIDVLKKLRALENPSEAVTMAIENTANLGEGKLDDLADARAEKEAAKDKKPEAKTDVKGKRYGGAAQKNDVPEKDDEDLDEGVKSPPARTVNGGYITKQDGKWVVDREDLDSGKRIVRRGELITFTKAGKTYIARVSNTANGRDDDCYLLKDIALTEGKLDDLADARAEKEAAKDKKPEAKTVVKGKKYGGADQKNDEPDKDLDESIDDLDDEIGFTTGTTKKEREEQDAADERKSDRRGGSGKDIEEGRLNEKSTSEKQARTMAAAAHNPKFAKKVGIAGKVAKEFNKADTGTKQLSNAMKHKKTVKEGAVKELLMDFLEALDTNQRIQRIALEGHGHFNDVYDAVENLLNTSEQYSHVGNNLKADLVAEGMKHLGFANGPSEDELNDFTDLSMRSGEMGMQGNDTPAGNRAWQQSQMDDDFEQLEGMFNESMGSEVMDADTVEHDMGQESKLNISTNLSSDGTKSVTVSADGDQADALLQMLKMAGIGGQGGSVAPTEVPHAAEIEVVDAGAEEVDEEDEYANTPEPTTHTSTSQMMDRGTDLNRPKKQNFPLRARGDNPMTAEAKLWNDYEYLKNKVVKK